MKTTAFYAFLILVSLGSFAVGQDSTPNEPRWKQLSQAYGFVLGQQASLELIEKNFPDLAQETKLSWFAFHSSALGESVNGVETELSKQLGDKWPEMKDKMTSQMQEMIEAQQFTREQATAFLAEVKLRAKGELPDTIRSTLLSAHPRFSANPGLELTEGWKQTYRTKGHTKAKGANFSVQYPISWNKRESERPNIIQVFRSGAGHGPITSTIMVKDIPFPAGYKATEAELKEFFQPKELKELVPDDGTFIDAKSIVLEGSPAGILVCDQTVQRLDISMTVRMTQFITIQGSSMISIQFMLTMMSDSTNSLDELQERYLPTYRLIASSIVFPDKWTSVAGTTTNSHSKQPSLSSLPVNNPPMLALTLIFSLIATWGVGLTPPLLIRYVFLRRPLSKKAASWIAGSFSVLFLLTFQFMNMALGEKPGKGFVWILVFFVARWIMSRGHSPESKFTAAC